MLISFEIENFRSIKEPQEFSMEADNSGAKSNNYFRWQPKVGEEIKLLNTAVIFGANASGKSNFVQAFQALWHLLNERRNVNSPIAQYQPFLFDRDTESAPCRFKIEFLGPRNYRYVYEISYGREQILSEALSYFTSSRASYLFRRKGPLPQNPAIHLVKHEESLKPKPKDDRVFANTPYLARFGQDSPHEWLSDLFSYFSGYFIIQAHQIHLLSEVKNIEKELGDNRKRLERLSDLVRYVDTGIVDIRLPDESRPAPTLYGTRENTYEMPQRRLGTFEDYSSTRNLPLGTKDEVAQRNAAAHGLMAAHSLYHAGENTGATKEIFFSEESTGTQQLLVLGNKILPILEKGGVIIIDELTNNLHFALSEFLVSLFQDELSNPNNAQLIITAHDTTLLKDNFRKDQVWFAEKNTTGATRFYSAFDFREVRDDTNLEHWYRTGKFRAKPHIKAMQFIHGTQE